MGGVEVGMVCFMKLDYYLLHSAGERGRGFNYDQLMLLGVRWPPPKGWLTNLIGKEIPDATWAKVCALRGLSKQKRRQLRKSGFFLPAAL